MFTFAFASSSSVFCTNKKELYSPLNIPNEIRKEVDDYSPTKRIKKLAKAILEGKDASEGIRNLPPEQLSQKTRRYQLTLMHIAAIAGNKSAVKILIDSPGSDVEIRDHSQWRPVDHAALYDRHSMIKLFQVSEGSYPYYPIKLHKAPGQPPQLIPGLFLRSVKKGGMHFQPVTPSLFLAKTGIKYLTTPFIPPSLIQKGWLMGLWKTVENAEDYDIYRIEESFLPKLYLKPKGTKSTEWQLCAKELIRNDDPIGILTGFIYDFELPPSLTFLDVEEGEKCGNHLSLIPHGFPNTYLLTLKMDGALAPHYNIQALRAIQPNETLFRNLGVCRKHFETPYNEPNPKDLEKWIQTHADLLRDPKMMIWIFKSKLTERPKCSDSLLFEGFAYLIQTPGAICKLILEGVIDREFCRELIQFLFVYPLIPEKYLNEYFVLIAICLEAKSKKKNLLDLLKQRGPLGIFEKYKEDSREYLVKLLNIDPDFSHRFHPSIHLEAPTDVFLFPDRSSEDPRSYLGICPNIRLKKPLLERLEGFKCRFPKSQDHFNSLEREICRFPDAYYQLPDREEELDALIDSLIGLNMHEDPALWEWAEGAFQNVLDHITRLNKEESNSSFDALITRAAEELDFYRFALQLPEICDMESVTQDKLIQKYESIINALYGLLRKTDNTTPMALFGTLVADFISAFNRNLFEAAKRDLDYNRIKTTIERSLHLEISQTLVKQDFYQRNRKITFGPKAHMMENLFGSITENVSKTGFANGNQ